MCLPFKVPCTSTTCSCLLGCSSQQPVTLPAIARGVLHMAGAREIVDRGEKGLASGGLSYGPQQSAQLTH